VHAPPLSLTIGRRGRCASPACAQDAACAGWETDRIPPYSCLRLPCCKLLVLGHAGAGLGWQDKVESDMNTGCVLALDA